MPFIPEQNYQQKQSNPNTIDLGSILNTLKDTVGTVGKTFFPRISSLPENVISQERDLFNQAKQGLSTGRIFNTPQQAWNINKQAFENTAPAAGEAAMFTVPGAEAGGSVLQKILSGILRYGTAGGIYGATTPGQISLGERASKTAASAGLSSALGPIIEGALNTIGIGAGKMAIKPDVTGQAGSIFEVPAAQDAAVKEALGQTTSLTTKGIAAQMGQKVADTTRIIKSSLEGIDNNYSFNNDIKNKMIDYVKEKVPQTQNLPSVPIKKVKGMENIYNLVKPYLERLNQTGQQSGITDTNHTLSSLFSARQSIDDLLQEQKAFQQSGQGVVPKLQTKVGLAIRSFLKDFVDQESQKAGYPGLSKLTEMEAKLYAAGKGIAGQSSRGVGMIPRSVQGLGVRALFGPSLIPVARASTSSKVQQGALLQILKAIGMQ